MKKSMTILLGSLTMANTDKVGLGDWVRFEATDKLDSDYMIEGELTHICSDSGECLIVGAHGQEFFVKSLSDLELVE